MEHRDIIIIRKIISEIDFAIGRIEGMSQEKFLGDIDAQHSVGMAVINVGELIKHISDETRRIYADIPWKQAAGFRDVAAHSYDTINMDDLYLTIKEDFTKLKEELRKILPVDTQADI